MAIFFFVAGLALLIVGAEALVRGATRLASALGVSPLVIGLTVVAFGTSSPELAVSLKATLSGQASVALGNVLGSNIFNILFILGLSALIVPLRVSQQLVRLDVPWMIALSGLVLAMALDGTLGRANGAILVAGLLGYVGFLFFQARRGEAEEALPPVGEARAPGRSRWFADLGLVVGGLALLVLGSRWLVDGAVAFAQALGVSQLVIGLTVVAAGTSLPEVVTSVVAALRGQRDIAVGNVVGSNIFNLLGVLGIASALAPDGIAVSPAVIAFDLPVVLAVAVVCLPIFLTGGVIDRLEGALLLGYYAAYTLYLVLAAAQHDALTAYGAVMLAFVVPLTLLALVGVALAEVRTKRRRQGGS